MSPRIIPDVEMMAAAKISPGRAHAEQEDAPLQALVEDAPDHSADDVADRGADEQADDPAGADGIDVVADLVAEQGTEEDDDEADALDEDHAAPPPAPGDVVLRHLVSHPSCVDGLPSRPRVTSKLSVPGPEP